MVQRDASFGEGRLFHRLFGSLLLLTLATVVVIGVFIDNNVRTNARAQLEDRLSYESTMLGQMMANALFGPLDDSDKNLENDIRALGAAVRTRLSLVTVEGKVVADSEGARGEPEDAAELVYARSLGVGAATRDGRIYVARSISRDGKLLGFARSSVPSSVVDGYVHEARARVAWGAGLAAIIAVVLGFFISRSIVQPVKRLADGARRIGAGDFEHAIVVESRDELGALAHAFNDMRVDLRETMSTLDHRNRDMRLVLDNIHQGLISVDLTGKMSPERSAVVARWFGPARSEVIWTYLAQTDHAGAARFELGFEAIVEDVMPLELNLAQMPKRLAVGPGRYDLTYEPIFQGAELAKILVVISDVTEQLTREAREAEQREMISVLEHLTRDKANFSRFISEADGLVEIITGGAVRNIPDEKRWLHTLKGNTALFGLNRLSLLCHELESTIADSVRTLGEPERERLRDAWLAFKSWSWMRQALVTQERRIEVDEGEIAAMVRAADGGASSAQMVRLVTEWRHERIEARFEILARQAVALAEKLGKAPLRIELSTDGLRCPPGLWEPFWGNLCHVVRNAIDHGLEGPTARALAHKSETALLTLRARRDGDQIAIEIEDDGGGIRWDAVASRARHAGLPADSHAQLVRALFSDGLSTAEEVTEISGRGVGLSAVHAVVSKLGGTIDVDSEAGVGTVFTFRLPTVAVPTRLSMRPRSIPAPAFH